LIFYPQEVLIIKYHNYLYVMGRGALIYLGVSARPNVFGLDAFLIVHMLR